MGGTYSNEQRDAVARDFSSAEMQALLKATHYTAEELIVLRTQFLTDVPEGSVTAQLFFTTAHVFGITHNLVATMLFRAFDANGDGLITFFEYARAMSVMTRGTNAEKLLLAFDMYDVDRRGELRMEAVLTILQGLESIYGPFVKAADAASAAQQSALRMSAIEVAQQMFERSPIMSRDQFREFALTNPAVVRGLALQ